MILTWELNIDGKKYASQIDIPHPKDLSQVEKITQTIEEQIRLSMQKILFDKTEIDELIESSSI